MRCLVRRRIALVIGAAGGVCALGLAGFALAGGVTVSLTNAGPQPAIATVPIGETVVFVGSGNENHSITSPTFSVPFIQPGQTYPIRLETPGKIAYQVTGFYRVHRGIIIVTVPGGLQLTASKTVVAYGQPLTLTGSSPLTNGRVALETKSSPRGAEKVTWTRVADVPTASDGSFSTVINPEARTIYRVSLGTIRSKPLTVDVAPVLSIAASARTLKAGSVLRVVSKVTPPAAATDLYLVRYDRTRKDRPWRTLMKAAVPGPGTVVFKWPVVAGRTLLRVQSSSATRSTGFASGASRSIVVTGIGQPEPAKGSRKKPRRSSG
jgi:hypothetical protein